ncbi:MAG: LysE family translocator [Rhodocyclaceae bacterium]
MRVFLLVALAHFIALLSPGQDFLLLLRTSLCHGVRSGMRAAAGIALANALWIVAALTLIGSVQHIDALLDALRWVGGAILIHVGWHCLRAPAAAPDAGALASPLGAFAAGFASGLSNPKNGLFYASLFALGISPTTSWLTKAAYGVWMTFAVFSWDCAVALAAGRLHGKPVVARWQRWIERGAGAALIGLGVAMALG